MTTVKQTELREKSYAEAMRYMANAKETLKKAGKEDNYYNDKKYVRSACGTAYSGVLVALDAYLKLKEIEMPQKKRRSINFYLENIAQLDRKLLKYLNLAYDTLHLSGYYDGNQDARVIAAGFDQAYYIIERIKPGE